MTGIALLSIVQVKAPRRFEGRQNCRKYFLPTETALVLSNFLTALTPPLVFTFEESILKFLLTTSFSTAVTVAILPRLYRLLRTLMAFLSGVGVVITRSLGKGQQKWATGLIWEGPNPGTVTL